MPMVDSIMDNIVNIASLGHSKVAGCADYGVSCEGWLKVELLHDLHELYAASNYIEIAPEKQNIDLTKSRHLLLELKTFPTNYGRTGEPIANVIDGVLGELRKLAEGRGAAGIGPSGLCGREISRRAGTPPDDT